MKYSIICSLFTILVLTGCHREEIEIVKDNSENSNLTKSADESYYWHNGEKVFLTPMDDKFYILYDSSNEAVLRSEGLNNGLNTPSQELILSSKIVPYNHPGKSNVQIANRHYRWNVILGDATSIETIIPDIVYVGRYFTNSDGKEVGLSHLFYVKLKKESDLQKLEKLAESHNVEIIGNNEYMPLWFTLACSKESSGNSLEMANLFYESNLFASCQPDLLCNDELSIVNDPYYDNQWHLHNTLYHGIDINFEAARSITTGDPDIIVAVMDQGVQLDHPDLNIFNISYDSETGQSPSNVYGNHGTRCAGLISAKTNNGIGVASIAPSCKVMSVSNSLAASPDSRQKRADGINFARLNGASVISNSWGSSVPYQIIDDAISYALTLGRNGLGCVVVFSSGNDWSNSVGYPANSHSDIITVGAVEKNGSRANFSNYGVDLDIVAPGSDIGYTTTTGSAYVSGISGTSFSCPLVAGVAALILSVNSSLTQKEVADIIETTAKKCGQYSYAISAGRTNGGWNNEMGYGLVDAYAAVLKAMDNETTYFNDKYVNADAIIYGNDIFSENVTVSNNASLIFKIKNEANINGDFIINKGSSFEISGN